MKLKVEYKATNAYDESYGSPPRAWFTSYLDVADYQADSVADEIKEAFEALVKRDIVVRYRITKEIIVASNCEVSI